MAFRTAYLLVGRVIALAAGVGGYLVYKAMGPGPVPVAPASSSAP